MKGLFAAVMLLISTQVFAGEMKEIYTMTNESVVKTLGPDADIVSIEGHNFVSFPGSDLAVETKVTTNPGEKTFFCVTLFIGDRDYQVLRTLCEE